MADPAGPPPSDRRYSKEHEWARTEADGTVIVGISDYAANELGDVVYVSLPAVGATLAQFEKFGEVESVKAVSDLFSPLGGAVVAINDALDREPELVNQSAFDQGWMVRLRPANPAELGALLDAAAYQAFLAELAAGGAH